MSIMGKSDPEKQKHYRPDIDGLRAIAILAVIAYHAGIPGFSGGFVGVDVFFVISGFLITRLLIEEARVTGTIHFLGFYSRRMKRLMPAFFSVVIGTLALILILAPGMEDSIRFANSIKWSMIGFANVFFKKNTGGYFDGASEEMPFLHFWSLAVEEQFYLVWPLLILACYRKKPGVVLSLLTLMSLVASEALVRNGSSPSAFYLMPFRAWELGLGGLMTFIPLSFSQWIGNFVRNVFSALGLAAIAFSVSAYGTSTLFPGLSAFVPTLGTAFLLLAGLGRNAISRGLANPLF